jgi:hypothetical protein
MWTAFLDLEFKDKIFVIALTSLVGGFAWAIGSGLAEAAKSKVLPSGTVTEK